MEIREIEDDFLAKHPIPFDALGDEINLVPKENGVLEDGRLAEPQ
jgi:hypothetical protein